MAVFTRDKSILLAFLTGAHFMVHVMLVAYVAITVEVGDEFGLTTNAQRLLPITLTLFVYGAVAVVTGYLADRYDALKMLTVGIVIATAASFCIAASINYGMLLAFMGVLGVGLGFYHPVGLSYISKVFGPKNRGKALGINGIGGNTGWLLSPIGTALIAVTFGWRWAYVTWGCLGLVFIILILYLFGSGTLTGNNAKVDETPVNGKRRRSGNGVVDRKNLEAESEETVAPTSAADYKMNLRRMLTFLALIVMLITIFRGFYFHGLTDTLPTFLQVEKPELLVSDDPGVKLILAGGFLSLLYMMGIIAEPLGGWIKDRYEARRPIMLASLANAGSLVILIYATTPLMLTVAVTTFGFCFLLLMSVVNATIADVTPPQVRGTFYGLTFLTRDGIGAFAPLFVGFVADSTGSFLNGYWVLAVAAVVTALLGMALRKGKQEQVG
ncbi:MAG: MFS transporter, partial [Candidatus Thermoplasmatota archaeon]|nr:MFS transporter [Candidatus Thermoplasmatota archaeon]